MENMNSMHLFLRSSICMRMNSGSAGQDILTNKDVAGKAEEIGDVGCKNVSLARASVKFRSLRSFAASGAQCTEIKRMEHSRWQPHCQD